MEGYGFSFGKGWWPATRAGEPTAHWSYLYTLYLAAVYTLVGSRPIVARLIQALIGGMLHSWLTWRLGQRIFGPTIGLVAAGLTSVYGYFVYYAGGLVTETLYIVCILWTLDIALSLVADARQAARAVNWWPWLKLGLAIGLTVLLRQLFLLFVPFLYFWLWWNLAQYAAGTGSRLRWLTWSSLRGFISTTVVIGLLIAPWSIRNYRVFGVFVPLNTNAGFALFWGNHPIHGTKFIPVLPTDGPSYGDLIPDELRLLNEAELDRALLRRAFGFISEDPGRFAWLSMSRSTEYFKFWPSAQSGLLSNICRVGSFGILLPFMLWGLWLSRSLVRRPSHHGQPAEITLLYLFMAMYTIIHLLTWTLIRYRLPVDAVLLMFAACGLADVGSRVQRLLESRPTTQDVLAR